MKGGAKRPTEQSVARCYRNCLRRRVVEIATVLKLISGFVSLLRKDCFRLRGAALCNALLHPNTSLVAGRPAVGLCLCFTKTPTIRTSGAADGKELLHSC